MEFPVSNRTKPFLQPYQMLHAIHYRNLCFPLYYVFRCFCNKTNLAESKISSVYSSTISKDSNKCSKIRVIIASKFITVTAMAMLTMKMKVNLLVRNLCFRSPNMLHNSASGDSTKWILSVSGDMHVKHHQCEKRLTLLTNLLSSPLD